jgi:hypothetical protein
MKKKDTRGEGAKTGEITGPDGGAAGRLAVVSVFVLALVLAFRKIASLDVGFHLRAGAWILENLRWPSTDTFTYTVPDHKYIDTHWLYQVMLVTLYRLKGPLALVATNSAFILAAFALGYLTALRRLPRPVLVAALLTPCVLASELRFIVRPETVSWVFLCLTILILERHADGKRSPLWALPAIHLLWVNMQGLFVLGLIAIGCYLVGNLADRSPIDRRLVLYACLSLPTCFLNPYWHEGFLHPLTQMAVMSEGSAFVDTISELTSPWRLNLSPSFPFYPRIALWSYYGWAVFSGLALVLTWRKHKAREFLLFLVFFALSAKAVRNIPLFMLISLPITAASLSALLSRRPRRSRRSRESRGPKPRLRSPARRPPAWTGAVAIIPVAAGLSLRVATNAYYASDRRTDEFGWSFHRTALPVKAAEFMHGHEINGRLFNHLNFGGYLMWAEAFFLDALHASGGRYYEIYSNLGAVYFKDGRHEKAAVCYREVLKEKPDNRLARERLNAIITR